MCASLLTGNEYQQVCFLLQQQVLPLCFDAVGVMAFVRFLCGRISHVRRQLRHSMFLTVFKTRLDAYRNVSILVLMNPVEIDPSFPKYE